MCPRADASEVDRRIAIPAALAAALLPFQTAGLRFGLERCGRVLLADEMGVGKTVQAIAFMAAYHVRIALLSDCPDSSRYRGRPHFLHADHVVLGFPDGVYCGLGQSLLALLSLGQVLATITPKITMEAF